MEETVVTNNKSFADAQVGTGNNSTATSVVGSSAATPGSFLLEKQSYDVNKVPGYSVL